MGMRVIIESESSLRSSDNGEGDLAEVDMLTLGVACLTVVLQDDLEVVIESVSRSNDNGEGDFSEVDVLTLGVACLTAALELW